MTPDLINGSFELIGGLLTLISVYRVMRDKQVHGVSWVHISFFSLWGVWNLAFYPLYHLWWSFMGGVLIVTANTIWVGLLLYYGRRPA